MARSIGWRFIESLGEGGMPDEEVQQFQRHLLRFIEADPRLRRAIELVARAWDQRQDYHRACPPQEKLLAYVFPTLPMDSHEHREVEEHLAFCQKCTLYAYRAVVGRREPSHELG